MTTAQTIQNTLTRQTCWNGKRDMEPTDNTLKEFLKLLRHHSVRRMCPRNSTIYTEQDQARFVYHVLEGVVRLCKYTDDGRRHIVSFMLPGDLFGHDQMRRNTVTAECATNAVLASYPAHRVDELSKDNAGFRAYLRDQISEDIQSLQRHLLLLGCHDTRERVASFLLDLKKRTPAGETLMLGMNRMDIADHLGIRAESVCRALRDLKAAGVISARSASELVVRDAGTLRALALAA